MVGLLLPSSNLTRLSIWYKQPPSISYDEIRVPLACSERVWNATTSAEAEQALQLTSGNVNCNYTYDQIIRNVLAGYFDYPKSWHNHLLVLMCKISFCLRATNQTQRSIIISGLKIFSQKLHHSRAHYPMSKFKRAGSCSTTSAPISWQDTIPWIQTATLALKRLSRSKNSFLV